jgi:hypothetical protein
MQNYNFESLTRSSHTLILVVPIWQRLHYVSKTELIHGFRGENAQHDVLNILI